MKKAWTQLGYDYFLLSEMFSDFTLEQVEFEAFACFPHTPWEKLSQVMQNNDGGECGQCMPWVLGQEDIKDPSLLRRKLNIAPTTAPVKRVGWANLLTAATRLFGLASLLHVDRRKFDQVDIAEKERMEENFMEVEHNLYILLSDNQREHMKVIEEATEEGEVCHVLIQGGSGSGKTLVMLKSLTKLLQKMMRKTVAENNRPLLVVSSCSKQPTSSPLMKQLDDATSHTGAERIFKSWPALLSDNGLKFDDYQTSEGRDDLPAQICAVLKVLSDKYPGRPIIAGLDELLGLLAPLTEDRRQRDWCGLTNIGSNIYIRAAFNPHSRLPLILPSGNSFLCLTSELRYRQTLCLTKLVDTVGKLSGQVVTPPGHCASDVAGTKPILVDLGEQVFRPLEAVDRVTSKIKGAVTVLYDKEISPSSVRVLKLLAEEREGWQVKRVGEYTGAEEEQVCVVGSGQPESISRARWRLSLVRGWDTMKGKELYKIYTPGYTQAENEGLLEKIDLDPLEEYDLGDSKFSPLYSPVLSDCEIDSDLKADQSDQLEKVTEGIIKLTQSMKEESVALFSMNCICWMWLMIVIVILTLVGMMLYSMNLPAVEVMSQSSITAEL